MPVIDFRFRPPTDEFKQQRQELTKMFGREAPKWYMDLDMETCVKRMEKVDLIGVVMGRDIPMSRISNEHVKSVVKKYPDRFVAFAGVDANPSNRRAAQDEINKVVRQWKFKGIQLEPGNLDPPMFPDDRRLYPIYAQCEDLGAIVAFQLGFSAGPGIEYAAPQPVERVALDFPELKVILIHGCYPYGAEAVALVRKCPNVWCSPGPYHQFPGNQIYLDFGNMPGFNKRYLWASAMPGFVMFDEYLDWWRKLPWKPEFVNDLLYNNGAELLGLKR